VPLTEYVLSVILIILYFSMEVVCMHAKIGFHGISFVLLLQITSLAIAFPASIETLDFSATALISESLTPGGQALSFVYEPLSNGANVVDQNQPSHPWNMAEFYQPDLAQSFMQYHANISGAGIFLRESKGSVNVTIQLWNNLPNQGGTMLAEASGTGVSYQWVDVFWSPIAITPATTYYLVFTGNSLGIKGDDTNPYPNGQMYANSGFQSFPDFDYAFRTYYETTFSLEPHTWAGVKASFN